ncbi:MAG TPA: CPBP family intramembrane glutamic endopeptidase [Anaerolineae bacterium]
MSGITEIIFVLGLILLANIIEKSRNEQYFRLFGWLLLALNIPLFLMGVLFVLIPEDQLAALEASTGLAIENTLAFGIILQAMALWGTLLSLRTSREVLARWLPLDPRSPVHALALVLSGYLVGNVTLVATQGGLERFAETAVAPSVFEVVLQGFIFVLAAFLGVGWLVRRGPRELLDRLGLERLTGKQVRLGLRWIVALVILQWAVGAIWFLLAPEQAELLGNINELLLGDFDTVWQWVLLALASGVGEELLFRGALQPVLGLWFTAILFALLHIQYGFTPITLVVFAIGVALGYIRRYQNTTMAIFIHTGYNFILGLLALLAPYLEQMVQ